MPGIPSTATSPTPGRGRRPARARLCSARAGTSSRRAVRASTRTDPATLVTQAPRPPPLGAALSAFLFHGFSFEGLDLQWAACLGSFTRRERRPEAPASEGDAVTTVEIESILGSEELMTLLEASESNGQLRQVELVEVLEPLELDPLETEAVYQELDRRGIELLVEPEREAEPERPPEKAPPPPVAQPLET